MHKMIRHGLAALAFACLALPAAAQCTGASFMERLTAQERAEVAAAAADTPFAGGLVWTAVRDTRTITVIGTMHIYDARLAPVHARIAPLVKDADLVLVEATQDDEAALQAALMDDPSLMFLTEGPTLPEMLDDETWAALMDAVRARQIPVMLAAKMQPWYLSLTLSMPPCAMADLIGGRRGLDQMIMDDAAAAGVPVAALEPWMTMFTLMREGTLDEQLDMLRLSLLAPDVQSELFVAMLDSYFAGEIALVWEVSRIAGRYVPDLDATAAEQMFAEVEDKLLVSRNHDWMPVILKAAEAHDTVVVAAGAAHLPGKDGVLNLLAQAGWDVQPAD